MHARQSRRKSVFSTVNGASSALAPTTASRLNRFEPITLPKAMSFAPCTLALTLTASSGADVPKATMVSPTMMVGMPSRCASAHAPETNQFAPSTSTVKPAASSAREVMRIPLSFVRCARFPSGEPFAGTKTRCKKSKLSIAPTYNKKSCYFQNTPSCAVAAVLTMCPTIHVSYSLFLPLYHAFAHLSI